MSLTDDWKAGKLEDGDYYVRLANDDIIIEHLCKGEWCFDYGWRDVIVEILALVPSYEELQRLKEYRQQANNDLAEIYDKNQQLRQLLKECKTGLKSIQDKGAYPEINLVFEEDYDALFCQATDLLTRINEVLK